MRPRLLDLFCGTGACAGCWDEEHCEGATEGCSCACTWDDAEDGQHEWHDHAPLKYGDEGVTGCPACERHWECPPATPDSAGSAFDRVDADGKADAIAAAIFDTAQS